MLKQSFKCTGRGNLFQLSVLLKHQGGFGLHEIHLKHFPVFSNLAVFMRTNASVYWCAAKITFI